MLKNHARLHTSFMLNLLIGTFSRLQKKFSRPETITSLSNNKLMCYCNDTHFGVDKGWMNQTVSAPHFLDHTEESPLNGTINSLRFFCLFFSVAMGSD